MARRKSPPSTFKATLYRLSTPEGPDLDLRVLVAERYLTHEGFKAIDFERGALRGLQVTGTIARGGRTAWCEVVEPLTGITTCEENRTAAGLLLVPTERFVYAITYGMGYLLIDPTRLDPGFGLAFAVRSLDENSITHVRHHLMDARGRTDENTATRGEHIRGFGIERYGDIVSKITGTGARLQLTHALDGNRPVRISGGDHSVKLPLARTPEQLMADLQVIESTCDQPEPLSGFDMIARVRPLRGRGSTDTIARLDAQLDELLVAPGTLRMTLATPGECLDRFGSAEAFRITRGKRSEVVEELALDDILAFVRDLPEGRRLPALRNTRIQMYNDRTAAEPSSPRVAAHRWITAEITGSPAHHFYWQGCWYEVGEEYISMVDAGVQELLDRPSTVTLPVWTKDKDHDEAWYNQEAAKQPGYVLCDRRTVHTTKFTGGGLEICDLLGPEGQLIHVKRADTSTAALNHLFAQGRASLEALRYDRQVREKFLARVADVAPDNPVKDRLRAPTVVFAILLKDGIPITVQSLFAFAQVSLLQTATALQGMGATVEVVAIKR